MAEMGVLAVDKVLGVETSIDGEQVMINIRSLGQDVHLTIPADQAAVLCDLAAKGGQDAARQKNKDPNIRPSFNVAWFEFGRVSDGGLDDGKLALSLTFGSGGTLTFILPDGMPEQMMAQLQPALRAKEPAEARAKTPAIAAKV